MSVTIKVLDANKVIESHQVPLKKTLILDAKDNVNYQLINNQTGYAPQNILTERDGNDLIIILEERDRGIRGGKDNETDPAIIIKDYYAQDGVSNLIVGLHENGSMYAYVPESGQVTDAISQLAAEMIKPQALGGTTLAGAFWVFNPWWLLGGLAVAGIIAAAAGGSSGGGGSTPAPAIEQANTPMPTANEDGSVIVVPGANNTTLSITYVDENGVTQSVEVVKAADGTWSATTALPAGVTIDTQTGAITIAESGVKDLSSVTAVGKETGKLDSNEVTGVAKEIPPTITLDPINAGDTVITGKTSPSATVTVTLPDGTTTVVVADENGNFIVNVDTPLPENAVVTAVATKGLTPSAPAEQITPDTTPPEINLDPIKAGDTQITGTTEPNATVTVTLPNGSTTVVVADNEGKFTVPLDTPITETDKVSAVATDKAGNTSTPGDSETAPKLEISVDDVTADNVINAIEKGETINVTGTVTGDFKAGDIVTLTINGKEFKGSVDANGKFSIPVDGSDLTSDSDLTIDASVTGTGGSQSYTKATTHKYNIDDTAPVIDVAPIKAGDKEITGTVDDPNAIVKITLPDGTVVDAVVDPTPNADGTYNFTAQVPDTVILEEGDKVTGTATDLAGNSASDTEQAPGLSITLDNITEDNVINAAEKGGKVNVTGTVTGDFQEGDEVTLTINGKPYTGKVDKEGKFSISVEGNDLATDGDSTVEASVVGTGGSQPYTKATTHEYEVDDTASVIEVDPIKAGDKEITGTVDDPNATVKITLPDGTVVDGVVDPTPNEDGIYNFKAQVPEEITLEEGQTVTGVATDEAGNVSDPDTEVAPKLEIMVDDVTADNVINAIEKGETIDVTGTVTGDFKAGDIVTLTINGKEYTGTVDKDGKFSIPVEGSDLATDEDVTIDASVVGTGGSQPYTKATTHEYEVDDTAPVIDVAPIKAGDKEITGTVDDPEATVEITLPNGDKVTATVDKDNPITGEDGKVSYPFKVDVPDTVTLEEGQTVTGTATDKAGNVSEPDSEIAPKLDITVDIVTNDNIVNVIEKSGTIPVTGKVTGDFQEGDIVTLIINGNEYTGPVDAYGNFSIDVDGNDLAEDSDVTIDASVVGTGGSQPYTKATTHEYEVDDQTPAIKLDPIKAGDTEITGVVSDPNATVELTLPNGEKVQGTVDKDNPIKDSEGNIIGYPFKADVPDTVTLEEGDKVTGIATDEAGNVSLPDTEKAPELTITVDEVTADNVINTIEKGETINVTGTVTGDFKAGDIVTLTINGKDYTGPVDADGKFSIDVEGNDLATDEDVTIDASVVGTGGSQPYTKATTHEYEVDDTAPVIDVAPIKAGDQEITGTVDDPNATVKITLPDGTVVDGVVDPTPNEDGTYHFKAQVPEEITLEEGQTVTGVATDEAGNVSDPDTEVAPKLEITVDDVTADNVINAIEKGETIDVTGTVTGDFKAGDIVTLTINGKEYTGTVDKDGKFSIPVEGSDLATDEDVTIDASVVGTGGSQPYTKATTHEYEVDATAPEIDIDPIKAGDTQITGTTESNATVTLTLPDGSTTTTVADENGKFTVPLETSVEEGQTVTGTATDAAGNVSEPDTEKSPELTITVDDVTADNVINAIEKGETINVTGTVTGDFKAGDIVTLTINGKPYTGPVDAEGKFSIDVEGNDLVTDEDVTIDASVVGTGGSQPYTKATTHEYEVDVTAPEIDIDPIKAGDTQITGTTEANATVTLTLPDGSTTTTVADENGKFTVPLETPVAEGQTVTGTATDAAGNVSEPDTEKAPELTITVDEVTADNVINAIEKGETINVTGTVTGDFKAGDIVTLTINGKNYTGPVDTDGKFSIDVEGNDLASDEDVTIDASVGGTGGSQPYTKATTHEYEVDVTAPVIDVAPIKAGDKEITGTVDDPNATVKITLPDGTVVDGVVDPTPNEDGTYHFKAQVPEEITLEEGQTVTGVATDEAGNVSDPDSEVAPKLEITVDDVTADNVINAIEKGETIDVTGTVTGDFQEGDEVTLTINGKEYTGTVDKDGKFSIPVEGNDLATDDDVTIDASVVGTGGSQPYTKATTHEYEVDDTAPVIDVAPIKAGDKEITGTVDDPNATVKITLPDGTVVDGVVDPTPNEDGTYNFKAQVPEEITLEEGQTVTGVATDEAGNVSDPDSEVAPKLEITVDDVTADNVINAIEKGETIDVTGTVTGDFQEGDIVTLTINGKEYTGTVDKDGKFSIPVEGSDLATDEDVTIDASVVGTGGSQPYTKATTHEYEVDDTAPVIDVAPIKAGDTQITGTTEANATVTLTLPDGSTTTTVADENGKFTVPLETPVEEGQTVTGTATDAAGNVSEPDTEKAPELTITIDDVTADNVINATEKGGKVNVTGTVTGDFKAGDEVTLIINGIPYTGPVDAEGKFTIEVEGNDLATDDDVTIDASVVGTGGSQPYTKATTHEYEVDITAPVVTIDSINALDNVITGTVDDPEATVEITLQDGTKVPATVDKDNPIKDEEGNIIGYPFTATVPESVELNTEDPVTATATDTVGNASNDDTIPVADRDRDGIPDAVEDGTEGYSYPEDAVAAAEVAKKAYEEALAKYGSTNGTTDTNKEAGTYSPTEIEELTKLKEALDTAIANANKAIEDMIAKVVDSERGATEEDKSVIEAYQARIPDPVEVPEVNDADNDGISDATEQAYRDQLVELREALKTAEENYNDVYAAKYEDGELTPSEAAELAGLAEEVYYARQELDNANALYDEKVGTTTSDEEDKPNYLHEECLTPWVTTPLIQEKQNAAGTFEQSTMVVKSFSDNLTLTITYTDEKGVEKKVVFHRLDAEGNPAIGGTLTLMEALSDPVEQFWGDYHWTRTNMSNAPTLKDMVWVQGDEVYFHPNAILDGSTMTATATNNLVPYGENGEYKHFECAEEATSTKTFANVPGDHIEGSAVVIFEQENFYYLVPYGAYWQQNSGTADPSVVVWRNGTTGKPMMEFTYIPKGETEEVTVYLSRFGSAGTQQTGLFTKQIVDGVEQYVFDHWISGSSSSSTTLSGVNSLYANSVSTADDVFFYQGNNLFIDKAKIEEGSLKANVIDYGNQSRYFTPLEIKAIEQDYTEEGGDYIVEVTHQAGKVELYTPSPYGVAKIDLGGDGEASLGGFVKYSTDRNSGGILTFNNMLGWDTILGSASDYDIYVSGPIGAAANTASYANQDISVHIVFVHHGIEVI